MPEYSVFIAVGSNIGDSIANTRRAIDRLQQLSDLPLQKSSLWRTAPVDCPPGSAMFVNAVVGLVPRRGETAESLLAKLQRIETEFGRQPKKELNEPRPLDLDIIVFGKERRVGEKLTLPHPRAHLRRFVLLPLSEVAPALLLPGQTKSVLELLEALGCDEGGQAVRVEEESHEKKRPKGRKGQKGPKGRKGRKGP